MSEAVSVAIGDASDIEDVMRIMTAAFDPAHGEAWSATQCAAALSMPGALLLTARSGDVAVGFALARTVFEETELLLLAVCPHRRRQRVGHALMQRLMSELLARDVAKLFLEVRENNSALSFYHRLGFRQVGFRKNYYRGMTGIYTHAVTLTCDLKERHR